MPAASLSRLGLAHMVPVAASSCRRALAMLLVAILLHLAALRRGKETGAPCVWQLVIRLRGAAAMSLLLVEHLKPCRVEVWRLLPKTHSRAVALLMCQLVPVRAVEAVRSRSPLEIRPTPVLLQSAPAALLASR